MFYRAPFLVLVVVACSSSSQEPPADAGPDHQAMMQTDASDAATADVSDGSPDVAPVTDAQPNEGQCAACTAMQCLNELQACGASQGCTNDLVTFNNCLGANQTSCGTMFAAGGSAQAALWACLSTKCSASCGTT
jgi:hypothetical protein